jgi:hypothetical protein
VFEKVASQNAEGALTETLPSIDDTLVAMKPGLFNAPY